MAFWRNPLIYANILQCSVKYFEIKWAKQAFKAMGSQDITTTHSIHVLSKSNAPWKTAISPGTFGSHLVHLFSLIYMYTQMSLAQWTTVTTGDDQAWDILEKALSSAVRQVDPAVWFSCCLLLAYDWSSNQLTSEWCLSFCICSNKKAWTELASLPVPFRLW